MIKRVFCYGFSNSLSTTMEDPKNAKDDISDGELEDATGGSDERLKRRRRKRRLTLEPGDFESRQVNKFNDWHI